MKMTHRKAVIVIFTMTLLIYQGVGYTETPEFQYSERPVGSVAENQPIGTEALRVTATNPDNVSLEFYGGGIDFSENRGHGAFRVEGEGNTAVIKTKVVLDYETQNFYTLMITVYDDFGFADYICVDINITNDPNDDDTNTPNRAPVFEDGEHTTRSISEDAPPGTIIGLPVAATDPDNDSVSYGLGIENPIENYGIIEMDFDTGQLRVGVFGLDYDTKSTFEVVIFADDGKGGKDRIDVTINILRASQ